MAIWSSFDLREIKFKWILIEILFYLLKYDHGWRNNKKFK